MNKLRTRCARENRSCRRSERGEQVLLFSPFSTKQSQTLITGGSHLGRPRPWLKSYIIYTRNYQHLNNENCLLNLAIKCTMQSWKLGEILEVLMWLPHCPIQFLQVDCVYQFKGGSKRYWSLKWVVEKLILNFSKYTNNLKTTLKLKKYIVTVKSKISFRNIKNCSIENIEKKCFIIFDTLLYRYFAFILGPYYSSPGITIWNIQGLYY